MGFAVTDTAHLTLAQWTQLRMLWDEWKSYPPEDVVWNAGVTLVALHEDEVVGFLAATYGGQPFAYIDMAIIREDFRGKGIAIYLLREMESRLYELGVRHVRAVCNPASERILSRLGWTPVTPEVIMEKDYE